MCLHNKNNFFRKVRQNTSGLFGEYYSMVYLIFSCTFNIYSIVVNCKEPLKWLYKFWLLNFLVMTDLF